MNDEHTAEKDRPLTLATAPSLFTTEAFAVAVLDDGSEVRMRNLGNRVEVRTWDKRGSCRPPALVVTYVGKHVIDVAPSRPIASEGSNDGE